MSDTPETDKVMASVGEAHVEACDSKRLRTKVVPSMPYCRVCHGKILASVGHSAGCPLATMEDMAKEVERSRRAEQWAKNRADYWLVAVRQMHGKLAMLKAEVRKLRSRTNADVLAPAGEKTPTKHTPTPQEAPESGLPSHALLALAESKEDSQETIYSAEALLLRKIAETSSDLVKGRGWEEFREAMGGMGCLEASHAAAVSAWEQWHADSEG